jgi:protein-S-isoprenylcysteine O-methyltransferase Ste14
MDTVRNGGAARELSNRELISEIRAKASLLAKKELELMKAEIRADVQAELATAKAFGIAAIAALFGANLLLVAGVLALATRIPGWVAALIIGGVFLVIGAVVAYVGWRRMVTNPLALTRQTLKEGVQWVKGHLA